MKSKIGATFGRGVYLSSPQNTNRQRDFIKSKPPPLRNDFKNIYLEFWLVHCMCTSNQLLK